MPGRCMPDQNIEKHEVQAHTAVYDSLDTRERWKEFGITRHNTPHLLNMCISTVWPERLVEKAPTNGLAKNESPSFLFHSTVRLISYDTPIVTNILRTHTHTLEPIRSQAFWSLLWLCHKLLGGKKTAINVSLRHRATMSGLLWNKKNFRAPRQYIRITLVWHPTWSGFSLPGLFQCLLR